MDRDALVPELAVPRSSKELPCLPGLDTVKYGFDSEVCVCVRSQRRIMFGDISASITLTIVGI